VVATTQMVVPLPQGHIVRKVAVIEDGLCIIDVGKIVLPIL